MVLSNDCLSWTDENRNGLSTSEAEKRLQLHGANKLEGAGQVSIWEILLRQISNSLTIVSILTLHDELYSRNTRSCSLPWHYPTELWISSKEQSSPP